MNIPRPSKIVQLSDTPVLELLLLTPARSIGACRALKNSCRRWLDVKFFWAAAVTLGKKPALPSVLSFMAMSSRFSEILIAKFFFKDIAMASSSDKARCAKPGL